MITDFKELTIPEGEVVKIEDSQGRVLWEKNTTLPYDAEIEYLQGTGRQYIDVGITPTTNMSFEIVCLVYGGTGNSYSICGSATGNTNSSIMFRALYGATYGMAVAFGVKEYNSLVVTPEQDTLYTLRCSSTELGINSATQSNSYSGTFDDLQGFHIFAVSGTSSASPRLRVYGFKMWNGSNLIRDMIPVRVESTGYMYDKVSKQLFGNAGTGAFGLGPDKQAGTIRALIIQDVNNFIKTINQNE